MVFCCWPFTFPRGSITSKADWLPFVTFSLLLTAWKLINFGLLLGHMEIGEDIQWRHPVLLRSSALRIATCCCTRDYNNEWQESTDDLLELLCCTWWNNHVQFSKLTIIFSGATVRAQRNSTKTSRHGPRRGSVISGTSPISRFSLLARIEIRRADSKLAMRNISRKKDSLITNLLEMIDSRLMSHCVTDTFDLWLWRCH